MTAQGFTREEAFQERQGPGPVKAEPNDLQRLLAQPKKFTKDERTIILQTCCGGASPQEADQLIAIAEARGLDPIKGECYFVKRETWDPVARAKVPRWAVQASIDSFRIKADETGLYDGQDEPEYEHNDAGEVTLARVRIWRKGIGRPFVGVARWNEYVQTDKDGNPTKFWKNAPYNQLAKCAEMLGFRKAFPARFAGVYGTEEMQQADNEPATSAGGRGGRPDFLASAPQRGPATAALSHDPVTGELPHTPSSTVTYDKSWTDGEATLRKEAAIKATILHHVELEQALVRTTTVADLLAVSRQCEAAYKKDQITLEQRAQLKDVYKAHKQRLEAPPPPAQQAEEATDDIPF